MNYNRLICILLTSMLPIFTACNAQEQSIPIQEQISSTYAVSISVGGVHSCALLNNGHVLCWGDNSSGQLGDETFAGRNTATEVVGLTDIVSISAGGEHTCALTKSGEVKCWGRNNYGQLGNGTKEIIMETAAIPDLKNVAVISAGSGHTCAVLIDGTAKCWGNNLSRRIGDGSSARLILSPAAVVGLEDSIKDISAGPEHTCALTNNGDVKCWGRNIDGELGIGQDINQSKTPTDVIGIDSNAITITTGFARSCTITDDGKAMCWGWVGFQQFSNTPVDLGRQDGKAKSITTGGAHICIVLESGKVSCVGENTKGQLGNGTTTDSQRFVDVKGLPNSVMAIGASYSYTCALTTIGEVWCWGDNIAGQLGDGTENDSNISVKVIGIIQ